MSEQVEEEMARIREALIPAADALKIWSENNPIKESFAEQTKSDLQKIRAYAEEFRQDVDEYFPADRRNGDRDPEAGLRKARHDSRNRLNHLFSLVQLLDLSEDYPAIAPYLETISNQLDNCLSVLSKTPPQDSPPPPPPKEMPLGAHPHPGVVLIADDDEENRNLMARFLEPSGHTLHFAKDGEEAVEQIDKILFDAVLLDIQMPKKDGFEVLESLRESGHLRQTPVIVVTSLEGEEDAVRCIKIGAEDFLSRPIRPALLMARLNASLEKKRLREQVFEQHFTPELARELARNPDPMKMQARHADVSLLFCDIRRFSMISERLGPSQTVDWLSGVMGEFSAKVIDRGGVLVDYTGDELLAMWGAPNHQPNHAELACSAALAIMESLEQLNKTWEPLVEAETCVGIGVNTGEALVGNIGTDRKFKYGPLGTTVNLASRVQGATKYLKTPILITGDTVAQLSDEFRTRRLCQVRVQNIVEPVDLHELACPDEAEDWARLARIYEEALLDYESNNLPAASAALSSVLIERPHDGPCLQLMYRVAEAMLLDDSGTEFSPVWELPGK